MRCLACLVSWLPKPLIAPEEGASAKNSASPRFELTLRDVFHEQLPVRDVVRIADEGRNRLFLWRAGHG